VKILTFRDGVAHFDGQPVFLVSADYPYYRDVPEHWRPKLEALRGLGIQAVTSYVPWRHHELRRDGVPEFDFAGRTLPSRNVLWFVELCRELDLPLILKVGPFIHAELNYGGLPDFVCPLVRPDIPSARDAAGEPVTWNGAVLRPEGAVARWPLPSFFGAAFRTETTRWLEAVGAEVLRPNCAPTGPVVAVQVGNEGIACDAQHAVWADDFGEPALDAFRDWLRAHYRDDLDVYNARHGSAWVRWEDIEPPRRWVTPADLRALEGYREWSEFLGYGQGQLLGEYARTLAVPMPALTNVNPPLAEPWGLDAWLSRVRPSNWEGLQYGFTNWIGLAADDVSVVSRYEVMAGIARGPNLEENWGFTAYYGPVYRHPIVAFHQTLAMIGVGATGYNLYTGVGTAVWDTELDCFNAHPYPSDAPIDASGQAAPLAGIAALLGRFLEAYGAELMGCRSSADVAWAIDRRAVQLGGWIADEGMPAGDGLCVAPGPILAGLQTALSDLGRALVFVDLDAADEARLAESKLLVVAGSPTMAADTQRLLANYCERGGRLAVVGEVPQLDGDLNRCNVLAQAGPMVVANLAALRSCLPALLEGTTAVEVRGGRAWIRFHPESDVHHVMALSDGSSEMEIRYSDRGRARRLQLSVAGGGGALLRIEAGEPTALLMKGSDERAGRSVAPACTVGSFRFAACEPGDLVATRGPDGWSAVSPLALNEAAGAYLGSTTHFYVEA